MSKPKKEVEITEAEWLSELQKISVDAEYCPRESGWFTTEDLARVLAKEKRVSLDGAKRTVRLLLVAAKKEGKLDDGGRVRQEGLGSDYTCPAFRFITGDKK